MTDDLLGSMITMAGTAVLAAGLSLLAIVAGGALVILFAIVTGIVRAVR